MKYTLKPHLFNQLQFNHFQTRYIIQQEKNIQVFFMNFMTITLKKTWLVIFVALLLVSGTTRAEVYPWRKVGGPTTNPGTNSEDGKGDSGVDNHHSYRSIDRPGIGN
ncbi:hypothetical protein L1987_05010 [Smallanthus sonchifolius]|uniref:Uncharacterized protein n=1 Tax=Smallanthus sonchifolius TaxID=185202 RepID=A0ACB9JU61_9ASTR|nr:hypothetical protein L1987_05010 [Smallanthus sonchifolius]